MKALHNYKNHQNRHSGQAQRDPESKNKGTGSPSPSSLIPAISWRAWCPLG